MRSLVAAVVLAAALAVIAAAPAAARKYRPPYGSDSSSLLDNSNSYWNEGSQAPAQKPKQSLGVYGSPLGEQGPYGQQPSKQCPSQYGSPSYKQPKARRW